METETIVFKSWQDYISWSWRNDTNIQYGQADTWHATRVRDSRIKLFYAYLQLPMVMTIRIHYGFRCEDDQNNMEKERVDDLYQVTIIHNYTNKPVYEMPRKKYVDFFVISVDILF